MRQRQLATDQAPLHSKTTEINQSIKSTMSSCDFLSDNPSQNPFTSQTGKWDFIVLNSKYPYIGTSRPRAVQRLAWRINSVNIRPIFRRGLPPFVARGNEKARAIPRRSHLTDLAFPHSLHGA